jgi:hypothetical protein
MILLRGSLGVYGEDLHELGGWWVHNDRGPHALKQLFASAVLARRERIGRVGATRAAVTMDDAELDDVLTVRDLEVPATMCDGHHLLFRQGRLTTTSHHRDPAPDTQCGKLLRQWEKGDRVHTVFDVVDGEAPFYERTVDPAPELTRLRNLLATGFRYRLLRDGVRTHPWLLDRLALTVVAEADTPAASWAGMVPTLWIGLRPSWRWNLKATPAIDGDLVTLETQPTLLSSAALRVTQPMKDDTDGSIGS